MSKSIVGVFGLAVMGRNLALNIAEHGYSVSVFNRTPEKTKAFIENSGFENITAAYSLAQFVDSLDKPRKIILMVRAGSAVDEAVGELLPLLSPGDILMDAGNSHYTDTIRRYHELKDAGISFLGVGVSGGEEGARQGPAIMPGGDKSAYELVAPILTDIAAKSDGAPCCAYIGENGAGHFVKMVHNGIEYADMQIICEAYALLKNILGMKPPLLRETFRRWNEGELASYLIEITADIFTKKDDETGGYMLDTILDIAGQKGTGKWTGQAALELGTAAPTITAAVFERSLSVDKDLRTEASKLYGSPPSGEKQDEDFAEQVRRALFAAKICSYAQGFSLLRSASEHFGWKLDLGGISMIFRGGCIIRAAFLNRINEAYSKDPTLKNLLLDGFFRNIVGGHLPAWRKVVVAAVEHGISVPGLSSALSYFDSFRTEELPLNLLQAQRDYFGAHMCRREGKEGLCHIEW